MCIQNQGTISMHDKINHDTCSRLSRKLLSWKPLSLIVIAINLKMTDRMASVTWILHEFQTKTFICTLFLFILFLFSCLFSWYFLFRKTASIIYTFNGFAEALHLRNSSSYCRFIYMKTSFYLGSCFETIWGVLLIFNPHQPYDAHKKKMF